MGRLIERYWRPVYWTVRASAGVGEHEARDLTQEFFIRILEGRVIGSVDPAKGSFRAYLRGALKYFLLESREKANRLKRGGGKPPLSLDFEDAGVEPADLGSEPEVALDRAWAFQMLREAVEDLDRSLRADGRAREADVFQAYEMSAEGVKPTYGEVGARFGLGPDDVWNILRMCRKRLRDGLVARIGNYVRSESDIFDELKELFGG